MTRHRLLPVALLLLAAAVSAHGRDLPFRCPASVTGGDGALLVLVDADRGVWRVDDPIPFVSGEGRFWRYLCRYQGGGREIEAVAHWVEIPRDDERPVLEGLCGDSAPPGVRRASGVQALVESTPAASPAARRLADDLLRAATTVAAECPGEDRDLELCPRWEILEKRSDGREVECVWSDLRPPSETESGRWEYACECSFGVFITGGRILRKGSSRYVREVVSEARSGRTFTVTYRGDFETAEHAVGSAFWVSEDGSSGDGIEFDARCVR